MKGSKKGSKGARSRRNATSQLRVPESAIVYTGPVRPPPQSTSVILRLFSTIFSNVTSTVGGSVVATFSNDPSGSADFTTLVGAYVEYRVVATKFSWVPLFSTYSTVSTAPNATTMVMGLVRDSSLTIPSTVAGVLQCQPYVFGPIMKPMSLTWRMNGTNDAIWQNTSSPGANAKVFFRSDGLSASVMYGDVVTEFLVQLRNPR
jgi:hypothetical protein